MGTCSAHPPLSALATGNRTSPGGYDPPVASWKRVASEAGLHPALLPPSRPLLLLPPEQWDSDSPVLRCVCVSDTHGAHADLVLPPGDVLIHSGDFMNAGEDVREELAPFVDWLRRQPFRHKIVVAGNHDRMMDTHEMAGKLDPLRVPDLRAAKALLRSVCTYLEDEATTIDGCTFYGSPWTPSAHGWGFYRERGACLGEVWEEMARSHAGRPIDVLVTHGPPLGVLDGKGRRKGAGTGTGTGTGTGAGNETGNEGLGRALQSEGCRHVGDEHLLRALAAMEIPPLYHVFGHVHGMYGTGTLRRVGGARYRAEQKVGRDRETGERKEEPKEGQRGLLPATPPAPAPT